MADATNTEGSQGGGFRFRDTTRAPLATPVRLRFDRLGGAVTAESADISMEGMFVKTEEPRPVGTLVQFEFDVVEGGEDGSEANPTGEVVQGLGDVVWVRANGGPSKPAGMGIQFRYVDTQSREHVARIVSDFVRKISGGSAASLPPTPGESHDNPGAQGMLELGASAEDGETGATKTALLSQLPGWESTTEGETEAGSVQVAPPAITPPAITPPAMAPPPMAAPPPAPASQTKGKGGPFGALLASEEKVAEEAGSRPANGSSPMAIPIAPGSGSFSLSVPHAEQHPEERDEERPANSLPPSLLGGLDGSIPVSDPEPLTDVSESQSSEAPGSAVHEVEPYRAETHEVGNYYGGSTRSSEGRHWWRSWVVLVVVLGALSLAAYFFEPWQYFGGAGKDHEAVAARSLSQSEPGESVEGEGTPTPPPMEVTAEASPMVEEEGAGSDDRAGSSPEITEVAEEGLLDQAEQSAASEDPSGEARSGRSGDRKLMDLAAADLADRTQVRLATSRALDSGEYSFLSLANPPRFVLKIQGIEEPFNARAQSVRFRRIRSGVHQVRGESELHLVFDMVSPDFQADVRLDRGELLITLR